MKHVLELLSNPDNLPIVAIIVLFPMIVVVMLIHGYKNDKASKIEHRIEKLHTWPNLLYIELIGALLTIIFLTVFSILVDAPLERIANLVSMPNPAKAPWYFVGLQELLVYFDPWIAGVFIPLTIIFGLASIPYIDPNPSGNGCYTIKKRKFAIFLFLFGFSLWVILIFIGTFMRGPGWAWFWPWEEWDQAKAAITIPLKPLPSLLGIPNGILSFIFGILVIIVWYFIWAILIAKFIKSKRSEIWEKITRLQFFVVVFLTGSMFGIVFKILLRLLFDVNYILVVPWIQRFNI